MKERVLFLCTGNSARSQMAEGLLRHLAGDRFEVASAGTRPVGLNPDAVAVMDELGVDISQHRSKLVDEFLDKQFDYVITVCDNAKGIVTGVSGECSAPTLEVRGPRCGKRAVEARRIVFRRVRDQIQGQVQQFLHRECSEEEMS